MTKPTPDLKDPIERDVELTPVSPGGNTIELLNRSEIDQQITTAKRYPRSISKFRKDALEMVTLNESIAKECVYALPRKEYDRESGNSVTKVIEGPSARFAEIILSAWGNARAGGRVVGESGEFVTAQGAFHDLERNVAITYEVQRRITNKKGVRFGADMIGVTSNAATSIALRNAIQKGIPKAFWADIYAAARKTIAGDVKTLANRRSDAIKEFAIFGVNEKMILTVLERAGIQDVTIDDLVTLHGFLTAIRDEGTPPEEIFGTPEAHKPKEQPKETKAETKTETKAKPAETKAAPADAPHEETRTEQAPKPKAKSVSAFED